MCFENAISLLKSSNKGVLNIGVTGGNTPKKYIPSLLESLSREFKVIRLYILDERIVDIKDVRSNYGLIDSLIDDQFREKVSLFSIEELSKVEDRLDAALLGFGLDGHILGLFPNLTYVNVDDSVVQSKEKVDGLLRKSCTLRWLEERCDHKFIIATRNKWERLAEGKLDYVYDSMKNVIKVCYD